MKIVVNKFIPFTGYKAINIFGILFVKSNKRISEQLINHESIHTAQMKELLYIGFYLFYAIEFLYNLIKYRDSEKAYKELSFEKEAYKYENYLSYLKTRKRFAMWRL